MRYIIIVLVVCFACFGVLYYFESPLLMKLFKNETQNTVAYSEEQFVKDLIALEKNRNNISKKLSENGLTMDDALNILLDDIKVAKKHK